MQIFFSVGEPSGDLHGSNLIRAIHARRPDWKCVGYGGPKMADAGCQLHADLTQLAVMWIAQAVLNIHKFLKLLIRADRFFRDERPDLVVLIDFPGFNWWIARRAKAHGIPVVYYGAPQLWAWAGWRVKKMRRYVDHVLCKLPFEETWFRDRGCHATHVGHPYFDELATQQLDQAFLEQLTSTSRPLVTILPGSRSQEIESNLASFLQTAWLIQQYVPEVRFAVAAFKQSQAKAIREQVAQTHLDIEVYHGRTGELIHAAKCCLACSGSVSLELLYHTKPTVILYQVSRFAFVVQKLLRKVRYITLVNLLTAPNPFGDRSAGIYDSQDPQDQHVLMPEYLTHEDKSLELSRHIIAWLKDEPLRSNTIRKLAELKSRVAEGGASERAAEYMVSLLEKADRGETAQFRQCA